MVLLLLLLLLLLFLKRDSILYGVGKVKGDEK